jgi:hypothetical protein
VDSLNEGSLSGSSDSSKAKPGSIDKTSSSSSTVCKALLPVANLPMISYQIKWFEEARISGINSLTKYPLSSCKVF